MNINKKYQQLYEHAQKKRILDEGSISVLKEKVQQYIEQTGEEDFGKIITMVIRFVFDEAFREGVLSSIQILQKRD